jgi:CDP-diglyceride synthetase
MWLHLLQALWFVLPILLAGLIQIAAIKLDWLPTLARRPLDGGLTFRGRRVFGDNKTVRGALVMIGATALVAAALALSCGALYRQLSVSAFQIAHPLLWGLLLGTGYIVGELPNSLVKRQLGIAPGAAAASARRPIFWIVDQLDSMIGVFLLLSIVWRTDVRFVVVIAVLTLCVHPVMAALMMALGLKDRIG